jgi:hypothetical protein
MSAQGYATALVLCAAPETVHAAVTNPRGWWGQLVDGASDAVGEEFTFDVPGVHWSRLRVAENDPTRVVWDVVDARIESRSGSWPSSAVPWTPSTSTSRRRPR